MNIKDLEFVEHVKSECKKYGVKCDLRKTKYVKVSGNMACSGYFDESVPILVCSMNRLDAIEILVHEFGHLTQWVDGIELWKRSSKSIMALDRWLSGKRVRDIEKHISVVRDLELDNEKRAVKIIKKFGLDIDVERYIKKANAYVFFYTRLLETRKWATPKNSPYKNNRLIESMPAYFRRDYSKIPKKIESVFIEENI